jgi:outer membrane protein assembly factor BamB
MPYDVVVDAAGQVVVSDSGRLLRVDAATGQQTIMAHNGDGRLGMPYGLTLAHDGAVIVANGRAIVRVNPRTGELQEVTSGGYLTAALDVAEGLNGDLFVVNVAWPESQIIRVNGRTGRQTVLTQGQFLNAPSCIVAQGQDLFVTDLATSDRNFGAGRVVQVNAANGHQEVITQGLPLLGPVGIAVDLDGHLVVSDPYLINPETTNYDGGILRLDRRSGELAILAQGSGSFVNPRGVAVMPRGMNARR